MDSNIDKEGVISEFQDSIGFLLHSLKQKMKQRMSEQLKPFGITTEQRAILLILSEHGSLTQSALGELASMEPSNLSVTLNRLASKEYITKTDHPSDSRAYLLNLTDKSKAIIDELKSLSGQINSPMLNGIEKIDIETTKQTLKKMLENLQ